MYREQETRLTGTHREVGLVGLAPGAVIAGCCRVAGVHRHAHVVLQLHAGRDGVGGCDVILISLQHCRAAAQLLRGGHSKLYRLVGLDNHARWLS